MMVLTRGSDDGEHVSFALITSAGLLLATLAVSFECWTFTEQPEDRRLFGLRLPNGTTRRFITLLLPYLCFKFPTTVWRLRKV